MRELIQVENDVQWLAERAKDITSTSVSALFGLSPYCTEFELYHAHRNGVILPFAENDRTAKGRAIEQYAAEVAAEKLGAKHVRRLNVYARIPGERFGSSFDFEIEFEDGLKALLELKAVDYFQHKNKWLQDEAPEHIEIQVQHQMEAIDAYDHAFIAAFTNIYDPHIYERQRDREFGAALRERTREFWRNVELGNEPKPDYSRDAEVLDALYRHAGGDLLDYTADADFNALLAKYRRVKDEAGRFAKEADELKAEIHHRMENNGGAYTEGFKLVCDWTKDSEGTLVTPEMVGTRIGARKGYRKCLVTDLTQKRRRA